MADFALILLLNAAVFAAKSRDLVMEINVFQGFFMKTICVLGVTFACRKGTIKGLKSM